MSKTVKKSQYEKMTETPISKLVVTLSIPTIASMLVTNIYNLVDTAFVGRLEGTGKSGQGVGLRPRIGRICRVFYVRSDNLIAWVPVS